MRANGSWWTQRVTLIGAAAVVTVLAVVAVLLLRGGGEDEGAERARAVTQRFLDAWADGELAAAAELTDDPAAAESLLDSVRTNTAPEEVSFEVTGPVDRPADAPDDARAVGFTARFLLPGLGEVVWDSVAVALPGDGSGWRLRWESALAHPELAEGETLVNSVRPAERAPLLAADETPVAGQGAVWRVSIWPAQLTDEERAWDVLAELDAGIDVAALAERVAEAEPDQAVPVVTLRDEVYAEHAEELGAVPGLQFAEEERTLALAARAVVGAVDPETGEGASGLQARYQDVLAGTPGAELVVADRESGEAVRTLLEEAGEPGQAVVTTLDPATQRAAEEALAEAESAGSIVALRPSTGEVLAAADTPVDGFARSLEGQLAPGSTFKILSAAHLLESGTAVDDALGCPRYVTVNGQRFENQGEFELGPDTSLREAFTASCNTAFIEQLDRFEHDSLAGVAESFGVGGAWEVGAATFDGSVPATAEPNELAASLIGQHQVQASPLVMASVAGTVAAGGFHQPVLVPAAVESPHQAGGELSAETLDALAGLMRATVTEGSASALAGVPGEPHAKTGTAEFQDEDGELATHAWMIGYLGADDLAFAVVLEDGGSGGRDAGPVAADFLTRR
ncbi:penicillin-binding transpeptidase domain-containing protein [Streptomyces sp. DSM 44915]|uniref:Penicillin-binding transpeptidase domain-containing protein n=1 Tax=Streptomyces chisholmiae TaxID=3075540 RepID=A0ABU2JSZ7_9ACTN|nr:penicillin-binding transpeptidase domain-containing protein [Streptomyces sp. DSM 44915]MDT0267849.1 penicillin-binding transpeptidase domain-containing protein [Streptomyces sp. DSM 44915]